MNYFEYTPENRAANRKERLALVCDKPRDSKRIMRDLVEISTAGILSNEEARTLSAANFDDLPVEFIAKLQAEAELEVIDGETGLSMHSPVNTGETRGPVFKVFTSEAHPAENDDPEYTRQIQNPAISHHAFQMQTSGVDENLRGTAITSDSLGHYSLGRMAGNTYMPILTVLNRAHPARQLAAEQLLQAA